jgi:molybdopterin molybdotransferase
MEWTEEMRGSEVKVLRAVAQGHNIRKCGGDIQKDAVVLEKGHVLRPQEIGALASLGKRFVEVYRPVRVAIVVTGNEIVDIDKPLTEGKIRNSNSYSLRALVQDLGGEPIDMGIARDEREGIKEKVLRGLDADVLITSGGVSVGKHDHVREILKEIGTDIRFWKVNIKPGMPMMYGLYRGKPVFGLPGNTVSTVVTFLQFVKPALLKMMGRRNASSTVKLHATLGHDIRKTDGKRHFIRGILEDNNGKLVVRDTGSQVSNVLSSLTKANCLVIIPEDKEIIHKGEEVEVELL